jgi:hypothetical protein
VTNTQAVVIAMRLLRYVKIEMLNPEISSFAYLVAHVMNPMRVIDRSTTIAHMETDLGRALLVTVIDESFDSMEICIRELNASRFELMISLLRSGLTSLIMALPDEDTMTRVYNARTTNDQPKLPPSCHALVVFHVFFSIIYVLSSQH